MVSIACDGQENEVKPDGTEDAAWLHRVFQCLRGPGRCHNFFYFQKGQPYGLAEQIHHILNTQPEPPSRCVELEQLTWKENVRPMVAAIGGC